jgi:hypothetical protein
MPSAGDALFIPSGAQGMHLFIVLNDPKPLPGYGTANHCVVVSITTIRATVPHDATCTLAAGSHPFVINPSYIYYRDVRVEREDHLENCIASNLFQIRLPSFPAAFIAQAVAGMDFSPTIRRSFRGILP